MNVYYEALIMRLGKSVKLQTLYQQPANKKLVNIPQPIFCHNNFIFYTISSKFKKILVL